jgi:hypothetical protein
MRRQLCIRRMMFLAVFVSILGSALGAYAQSSNLLLDRTPSTEYQAFLSPQQEPGPDTGSNIRGVAEITFDAFLTKAHVEVLFFHINVDNITAFHIHCGPPSTLGPVIVNFADFVASGDVRDLISNRRVSVTVTNDKLTFIDTLPDDPPDTPRLPEGCPNNIFLPGQANTIAALEALARLGVLYFNFHTSTFGDTSEFFGEMRGQVYPVP